MYYELISRYNFLSRYGVYIALYCPKWTFTPVAQEIRALTNEHRVGEAKVCFCSTGLFDTHHLQYISKKSFLFGSFRSMALLSFCSFTVHLLFNYCFCSFCFARYVLFCTDVSTSFAGA